MFTKVDPGDNTYTTLQLPNPPSPFNIFSQIISNDLISKIVASVDPCEWVISTVGRNKVTSTDDNIKIALAIEIYLISTGSQGRLLRRAIPDALSHLNQVRKPDLGINKIERIISTFTINSCFFADLSTNFQNLVRLLGLYVCGDDKLYHYTAEELRSPENLLVWDLGWSNYSHHWKFMIPMHSSSKQILVGARLLPQHMLHTMSRWSM